MEYDGGGSTGVSCARSPPESGQAGIHPIATYSMGANVRIWPEMAKASLVRGVSAFAKIAEVVVGGA